MLSIAAKVADAVAEAANRPLVVAVSGGSDSLAVLILLHEAMARAGKAGLVRAATVDHGLRAESADEAAAVGQVCRSLGVAHVVLRPQRQLSGPGLQATARAVRYDLLGDHGATLSGDVVVAHTANDQRETLAMRAVRGEGPGLAGIPPATLWRGRTWFLRPFLAVARHALRDELVLRGMGWVDDPSNCDPAFERATVRLAASSAGAPDPAVAIRWQAIRSELARDVGRVIGDPARLDLDGFPSRLSFPRDATPAGVAAALIDLAGMASGLRTRMLSPAGRAMVDRFVSTAANGQALDIGGLRLAMSGGRIIAVPAPRATPRRAPGWPDLVPSFEYPAFAAFARRLGWAMPAADPPEPVVTTA